MCFLQQLFLQNQIFWKLVAQEAKFFHHQAPILSAGMQIFLFTCEFKYQFQS